MAELAYLVWELQAVRRRDRQHRERDPTSPEFIVSATRVQIVATSLCLLLAFAGDILGFFDVSSEYSGLRGVYAALLGVELLLLAIDVVVAALAGSAWLYGVMGENGLSSRERSLHRFSVLMALAFSFLVDLPMNIVKFTFLHLTRFSSTETKNLLLVSGILCALNAAGKTVLYLLHYVWKQMTPRMDPLNEKAPTYFPSSTFADSCLWGINMMMPVVNMFFSVAVLCMAFSATALT